MFCGNCGKEVADDLKFCPHCGNAMDSKDKGHIDEEKVAPINQDGKESIQNMAESFKNKPWNTWQNVLILLVVFIVIIGIFSPDKKTEGSSEQTTEISAEESAPASVNQEENTNNTDDDQLITITSGQLLSEFRNNALRANDEYKDKKLKMSGVVFLIIEQDGQVAMVFNDGSESSISGVQCNFANAQESEQLKSINKGDSITVIGTVNGFTSNVIATECTLVN